MQRRPWIMVAVLALVGLAKCSGSGGAADAAAADWSGVDVLDTAPETAPADAMVDGDVVPAAWVPSVPVEAQLVFPQFTSSEGIAIDGQGRFLLTANDALMRLAPGGMPEKLVDIPLAPDQTTVGYAGLAWHPVWGAVFAQTTGSRLFRWSENDGLV